MFWKQQFRTAQHVAAVCQTKPVCEAASLALPDGPKGGGRLCHCTPSVTAPRSRPAHVIRELRVRSAGRGCSREDRERPPPRVWGDAGAAGWTRARAGPRGKSPAPDRVRLLPLCLAAGGMAFHCHSHGHSQASRGHRDTLTAPVHPSPTPAQRSLIQVSLIFAGTHPKNTLILKTNLNIHFYCKSNVRV